MKWVNKICIFKFHSGFQRLFRCWWCRSCCQGTMCLSKTGPRYVPAGQFISLTVVPASPLWEPGERQRKEDTEGRQQWGRWSRAQFGHQTQRERCEGWRAGQRCQEGAVSWLHFQPSHGNPTHVATMWQQTSSHYPQGSLPSICSRSEKLTTWLHWTCSKGFRVLGKSGKMRN